MYLGPYQASKMEIFLQKWLATLRREIPSSKAPSVVLDRVLYVSMFVVTESLQSIQETI